MKEKDILWESTCETLWVGKAKFGFTLYQNGVTHSKGFLTFGKLSDAIENGESLAGRPDLVEKLIW